MRSIRLTLTVYFLGLLGVSLGGASWFLYATAQETLKSKRNAAAALLESQYEERCREERTQLDKALFDQAITLARLAQFEFQFDISRVRRHNQIGLLTAGIAPGGVAAVPVWLMESVRGQASFSLYSQKATEIRLSQSDLLDHADGQVAEYFQVNSSWGSAYHSKTLGKNALPFDPLAFSPDATLAWRPADDVELEPGVIVRRVLIKASPMVGIRQRPGPPPGAEPPQDRERRPRDFPPPLALYVQCACSIHRLDSALLTYANARDELLAALDRETDESLATLRYRLLGVAAAAFAAAGLGCLVLVRIGLDPLRRLSEAVSRVSAKDFRLAFDGPRPPTELRPIVARLSDTLDLLKRTFAREKQATADISHELRTPLAALLTTTEMALRRPRNADEYQEFLRDCQSSARHMSRAVERLLALARLDAGVDTMRPQAVDASMLAEQCASVVRPLAEARGLQLAVHVEGQQIPQLNTDPDKLREVLTNLLHNAVQYNKPGGQIDVSLERENGHLEFAVSDTGVGIAPAARAHLFERYWRADPSRGEDGLHAGLGLAIAKGYVELMGGTISVESAEGEGSTFRVRLPA